MIDKEKFAELLELLQFSKEGEVYKKSFEKFNCELVADFEEEKLIYPKGLQVHSSVVANFSAPENFVVFECVHRLIEQGYNPKHIELEKEWQIGHSKKGGRADIYIKDNEERPIIIIECKTAGREYQRAINILESESSNQLFSYFQQAPDTKFLALYTSDLIDGKVEYQYYLINVQDNQELLANNPKLDSYRDAHSVEDKWRVWRETYDGEYSQKGLFENSEPYRIGKDKFTIDDLKVISQKEIGEKYHQFATILRKYNVSGRENSFDKLVNLLLCKVVDEKRNPEELQFYWKGKAYDDPFDFQDRLQRLYKAGMEEFLGEDITYIDNKEIERMFRDYDLDMLEKHVKETFKKLKFFQQNDFAFLEVHNEKLFYQNFEILLEVVNMIQDIRFTSSQDNQFLGDLFEGFLDQGIKQSEGQFFTPLPIVRFIINSLPELEKPKVIDYACGAGHFLNEYANINRESKIVGIEKEYRLSKVAKVSSFMYGHDIEILYNDALVEHSSIENGTFDLLISNPPYSVKGFLETLSPEDREKFELIKTIDEKSYLSNNAIETFFIERAKQLVKVGGLTSIIVPSSILNKGSNNIVSGKKNIYVATREILLKYFEIVAIVEFGSGTFGKTGTNTVTLFLQRRDDNIVDTYSELASNIYDKSSPEKQQFYKEKDLLDRYCEYNKFDRDIYISFLKGDLEDSIFQYEIFREYKDSFENLSETKKRRKKKKRELSLFEEEKEERKRLIQYMKLIEKEKFIYFCLAYKNSRDVVVVRSPSKNSEIKKFLGYEWSNAKGNEGIHYIANSSIRKGAEEEHRVLDNFIGLDNIQTPLYNPENVDDETRINKIIRDNFEKGDFTIPEELEKFVSRVELVDMLDFSVVEFNKSLNLNPSRKVEIRSKWELVKLGEVVEFLPKSKRPASDGLEKGKYPFFTSSSEQNKWLNVADYKKESIIIGDGGNSSIFISEMFSASDHNFVLSSRTDKLLNRYIYEFYKSNFYLIEHGLHGIGIKNISKKYLQSLPIPLPPPEIQKKIVEECQKVDDEVEKAEKENKQLREEIKEIISNVDGEMVKLDNLMEITRGASPRPIRKFLTEDKNGINWIKIGDVSLESKYITKTKEKITKQGSLQSKKVKKGDIILSNSMSYGRPYILDIDGCVHDGWLIFSEIKTKRLDKLYLYYILTSEPVQQQFSTLATGTTVDNLNILRVKKTKIPLPPLQTQKEIVSKIEKLETKIKHNQTIIDSAKSKKEEILNKYLL